MTKKISAGILGYRKVNDVLEFLLAHPGGPFNKNKDLGAWSIVKGEVNDDEDFLLAAQREFAEETGIVLPGKFIQLGSVKQKGGKTVHAWASEVTWNPEEEFVSNKAEIEWPPKSGKKILVPEIDKLDFFRLEEALLKINEAQRELIHRSIALI